MRCRDHVDLGLGAGDRGHPAPQGPDQLDRGAARLVADTLTVAQRCGATGLVVVRADSAFFNADVVAAIRAVTGSPSPPATTRRWWPRSAAFRTGLDADPLPEAIWDEAERRWVSDAEVAETGYTAFTSRRIDRHVTAG